MTAPLDPHSEHDFRQLTGAFDRPIAPSPHFADALKKRIQAEADKETTPLFADAPISHRTASSSSQSISRRRWPDIGIAAAIIIGILGSTFWYADVRIGGNGPSQPEATRYAAQPLSAVSTPVTEARGGAFGGTSDRSVVNPDRPGPSGPLTMAWSQIIPDPIWGMAYNDVVASFGSSEIRVQDAATGQMLWSKPTSEAFRNEIYDTGRNPMLLLGQRKGLSIALPWIESDTMYWTTTTELVGVDLHTGEETFRTIHTVPDGNADPDKLFFPWDMAVRDGIAYVLTTPSPGYYVLHAIELQSGDTLWSYQTGEPVAEWSLASTFLSQLVVTENVVAMQVSNVENSIVALDVSDGSVLWQVPNALVGDGDSIASSNLSAIDDRYLVLTHRSMPTGASNGTPNADQSLGVALYNVEDGYLLSTAREGTGSWTYPGQGTGACSLVPGWTGTDLYIPCSTEDQVYLFDLPFTGNVSLLGSWETSAMAFPTYYDGRSAYLGTTDSLIRIDYYTQEMTVIPLSGGETCNGGLPAGNGSVLCMSDDGLGTYTLQVYVPGAVATP